MPNCCQTGWKITLAGSRFLQDAETRYAPIEGEALAVAWGLEQTKYFTLGCDDLLVVTDHKPLTKILGDRMLDEIHNTRLFRLKQRTPSCTMGFQRSVLRKTPVNQRIKATLVFTRFLQQ